MPAGRAGRGHAGDVWGRQGRRVPAGERGDRRAEGESLGQFDEADDVAVGATAETVEVLVLRVVRVDYEARLAVVVERAPPTPPPQPAGSQGDTVPRRDVGERVIAPDRGSVDARGDAGNHAAGARLLGGSAARKREGRQGREVTPLPGSDSARRWQ